MTEQEVINDIKEKKLGVYKREDLLQIVADIKDICDKAKMDTPLSTEILFGKYLAMPNVWRRVRNLQETIDIVLDNREFWENPNDDTKLTNDDLYSSIFSMRMALHNTLAWLMETSKYRDVYKWLDTEESFYQKDLAKRNERAVNPFKYAQWQLEQKMNAKTHPVSYSSASCTFNYLDYVKGKDGVMYNIDKEGNISKSGENLSQIAIKNERIA